MTACRTPSDAAVVELPPPVAVRKKSSKNFVRTAIAVVISAAVDAAPSVRAISPSASLVKKSTPTARTSGAAKGSTISGFDSLLARARAAATIVAVAPTLDATSQLSASVRLTGSLSSVCPPHVRAQTPR